MWTCGDVHKWSGEAETLADPPAEASAHLAECDHCLRKVRLLQRAATLSREASRSPQPSIPDFDTVSRAAAPSLRGVRWSFAAAAASLATLAIAWWAVRPGVDEPPASAPPAVAIQAGQTVETATGTVVLSDPRTGSVALGPVTRVRVAAWAPEATELWVDSGRLEVSVRHRGPGQTFRVRTEYVEITVVGTRFVVVHYPGAGTQISTLEGVVRVTVPGAEGRAIAAGESLFVGPAGEAPAPAPADASGAGQQAPVATPPWVSLANVSRTPLPADVQIASVANVRQNASPLAPVVVPPRREPSDPEQALDVARRALAEGRPEQAVGVLAALTDQAGERRSAVLALLADAYRVAGRGEDARTAYERAIGAATPVERPALMVDLATLLQADLHRPGDAGRVWTSYLDRYPAGRYVGRALWELAAIADAGGRTVQAEALRRRIADQAPDGPEALPALADVGRRLIERGDLDAAAEWFEKRCAGTGALAEVARVGLMRVRLQQGRAQDLCRLAGEYRQAFPEGVRSRDVQRLAEAAACPPR